MPEVLNAYAVSEIELVYRTNIDAADRPLIKDSETAFKVLLNVWDMNKIEMVEEFGILLLNDADYCLGFAHLSTGNISRCAVDVRTVFATAMKANATSIILVHNHPAGDVNPSDDDLYMTDTFIAIGKLMTISIKDHLIISPKRFYSFDDDGTLDI